MKEDSLPRSGRGLVFLAGLLLGAGVAGIVLAINMRNGKEIAERTRYSQNDEKVDEMLRETFPASDPPGY